MLGSHHQSLFTNQALASACTPLATTFEDNPISYLSWTGHLNIKGFHGLRVEGSVDVAKLALKDLAKKVGYRVKLSQSTDQQSGRAGKTILTRSSRC